MKGLNYDIVRRSDAARRSSKRAEARLARKFNEAGGIEDEMRYHLANMKREQASLRRELQGLKFEYKKITKEANSKNGIIHKAHPGEVEHNDENGEREDKSKENPKSAGDYGKNYFGYHSSPGSHKSHNRTVREIEKSLECYFETSNNEAAEHEAKKKLKHQKKHNKTVQDKVETWKEKNTSRRRFSTTVPPNLRHLAFLRKELVNNDTNIEENEPNSPNVTTLPPLPKQSDEKKSPRVTSPAPNDVTSLERVVEVDATKPCEKRTSVVSSTNKTQKASDLVFDADLYAPYGKLRMAHRLPDFTKAFNEAKQARYVRTRHKREFERKMSVGEIFKD
uniref:Uncharacterized LOC100183521 n=1 Tax=Ciona intestinalis TaxID=7719 RepID=F6VV11_CIOIN|nr:uncharacterized protein LOC100183521 [Ciona intestinalis]|eukprot:XP_002124399.4 uncharacterized protein LOC100183521 [Ciona intestinalis]